MTTLSYTTVKKPIDFDIDGEKFTTVPAVAAGLILDLAAMDNATSTNAFFAAVLSETDGTGETVRADPAVLTETIAGLARAAVVEQWSIQRLGAEIAAARADAVKADPTSSRGRFLTRMRDKANPIDPTTMNKLIEDLNEEMTKRPTELSSGSPDGSMPTSSTSTAH